MIIWIRKIFWRQSKRIWTLHWRIKLWFNVANKSVSYKNVTYTFVSYTFVSYLCIKIWTSWELSLLFINIIESLSTTQIYFLKAVLANEAQLSSRETLKKYKLGTSANIIRIKRALLEREIIDITGDKINIQDPMYSHWLRKYYFKIW